MMILYRGNFCKFALEANSFKKFIFIFMLKFIKNTFYVQMTSYLGGCLAGTAGGGAEGVAA